MVGEKAMVDINAEPAPEDGLAACSVKGLLTKEDKNREVPRDKSCSPKGISSSGPTRVKASVAPGD